MLSNTIPAINAAKTHCIRNHPFSGPGSSVYLTPKGGRQCRHCKYMLRAGLVQSSRKA